MSRANEVSRGTMRLTVNFKPGWHCYLLYCSDNSDYCGITSNLTRRLRDHASGKGPGYTKGAKPVAFVWYEPHLDRRSAAERELQIKAWSRAKKRSLANGDETFAGMGRRMAVSLG
jgi:putative endonuclease